MSKLFAGLTAAHLLLSPTLAHADLRSRSGPHSLITDSRQLYKFDAAYGNGVYLIVWGTQAFGAANGLFVDPNGNPIGGRFDISGGGQWAGWARVIYAPEEGKFLVSYTKILGWSSHQRVARFVTYHGPGNWQLSEEIVIDTWAGGSGGQPGMAYTPARSDRSGRFLVTWWNDNEGPPQSYVAVMDPHGNILGTSKITTSGDGQTDSEIACDAARDRCMVIGFSWGAFTNALPATWGNYISASTGEPLNGSNSAFIVDAWRDENDASITFSAAGDRYIVAFARNFSTIWGVTVDAATLSRSQPYLMKQSTDPSTDGGGFGRPRMSYNPVSQTTLVSMNPWMARTAALEIDRNGMPISYDIMPMVAHYNHGTKDAVPAANLNSGQFLVADNQNFLTIRGAIYTVTGGSGGGGGEGGTPPPSCDMTFSRPGDGFGPLGGGGAFTLTVGSTCSWSMSSNAPWLSISAGSVAGTGSSTIGYSVAPNPGAAQRSGIIYSGSRSFVVTQAGAGIRLNDLNGDGLNDLIWQNRMTGELAIWRMNGVNQLSGAYLNPGNVADTNWKVVGTLDADKDGFVDLLLQHDAGHLVVWRMLGETRVDLIHLAASVVAEPSWRVIATGDFDRDGFADIFWQHADGRVAVWYMVGTQLRDGVLLASPSDPQWRLAGVEDFNADGRLDLFWRHASGQMLVWHMDNGAFVGSSPLALGVPNADWQIAALADFSGDGKPDVIWRNRQTGETAAWFMDGTTFLNAWALNPGLVHPNWVLVGPR